MEDMKKTKQQLIGELARLRQRVAQMEASRAKLSEAAEQLHFQGEILQNMAEGVQVTRTRDQVIVYANPRFEEMFGYGHDELVGKHVSVLNASGERTPEEVAKEIIKELEAKGVWSGEVHNIKKDGTPFWCWANVSTFKHPQHGTVWVAVHEDITARKQAQEALRQAEANFRNSLDSSPLGVRIITAEGELLYANRAILEMYGYDSVEELRQTPTRERYTAQSYAEHEERKRKRKMGKFVPPSYEISIVRKDGKVRHLRAFRSEIIWNGERQFQTVYEDITEPKQAEETLRRQRDELSARARVTSHLLRTFDLEARLNAILDEVMALVGADMGSIWLRSGEELQLRCWRGIPDEVRARVIAQQAQYEFPGLREFTILHEPVSQPGQIPRFAKDAGIQALVSVPLTMTKDSGAETEGEWLGTLMLASHRQEALGEKDILTVKAMADQLALAVDHSLQFQQASQRLTRLGVLRAVDRGIIGHLSIPEILAAVVEGVPRELGADAIAISLFSPDRARTQVCLMRLPNGTVVEKEAFTLADSLLHWLVERQEPVIIYDLAADPRLQMHGRLIRKHRLASYLGMPLVVEGRTIGILHVLTAQPRVFAPEDMEFFQTLAGQAAIAIRSAGLYEQVQQSEKRYHTILDDMLEGCQIIGYDWRYLYLNDAAARQGRRRKEELLGRTMMEMYPGIEKTAMFASLKQCMKKRVPQRLGNEFSFPDGIKGWFELSVEPMPEGIFMLSMDITERKQAEAKAREMEALKEVDRLRAGLLANVSHELRTPLTSILGFTSTLLRTDTRWSEEEQRDFLQTVQQESRRLARLVDDLLDMSRLESGTYRLSKASHDISQMLEQASSRLASLMEHHRLEVKVPEGLPLVFIDEDGIWQVLGNLVGNAAKFSPPGSRITIAAQPSGEEVIVSVIDRGQGIPAALLDKVFDRFYQAESIVSGRKKGTGLGLSISKGIIEAHGGRIWAESQVGEGSRFSFSLPVSKGE